ncbi:helix-turn-helix domain-containing protein [Phenylobacterium sp.]|uniref:helix-turn-helix domain-containing protein n=1 Tax=Phenylobacterium sp. TaxID=1871053 RepID=UPI0027374EE9|nr:helix-turn-helix transcriptional regulator [Phenylobacterium sp.]MDP3854574.1 helix-turn-helix transcriptional regulator [Phenylobacterium sp.]
MALDEAIGPDPVDIAIGARLRLRRKSLGISQGALAERIGVSFQQVQKYERGANRVSGSTLVAVAAALDTTVGWLVGEEGAISDAADDIVQSLAISGAVELLEAYSDIPKASARAALVALAREMAERHGA